MYSFGSSYRRTLADDYRVWTEKPHSSAVQQAMEETLRAAIREVLEFDPESSPEMPQDELIRRADQLACFSSEYDRLALCGGLSYHDGPVYHRVLASSCLNCLFLAAMLNSREQSLLLPEKFAAEYDWKRLQPCYGETKLKHVGILVDGFGTADPQEKDSEVIGHIWDAVEDRCYCVLLQHTGSFTEMEHGYPNEINTYRENYIVTEPDEAFLVKKNAWLAQPKLSREAAAEGLLGKRARYTAQRR